MDTGIMHPVRENARPTVESTSPSHFFQSEPSCLPPRHPMSPEPSCAANVPIGVPHGKSASPALTSTITPQTGSLPLPTDEEIFEYFRSEVPGEGTKRNKRVRYLVQAAKGFGEAASRRRGRTRVLAETLLGIDNTFLRRIYIAHHVGLSEKEIERERKKGVRRLTAAIKKTAENLSLEVADVRINRQQGRRYMELALHESGGLGLLPLTGRRASIVWRRRLQDGDVEILLKYEEKYLPHHRAKAAELNAPMSKLIIEYMVANGYRYEELPSIESELMSCVGKHIDLEELARDKRAESALNHPLMCPGEQTGDLSPDQPTSERASAGLAFTELLEAAEQRDITEFMTKSSALLGSPLIYDQVASRAIEQLPMALLSTYSFSNPYLWWEAAAEDTAGLAFTELLEAAEQRDITEFMTKSSALLEFRQW